MSIFSENLRLQSNLSQKELSMQLNIEVSTYANWEQGRTEPSLTILIKLANYFNVTTDYLLGATNNKANQDLTNYEILLLEEQEKLDTERKKDLLNYAKYLVYCNNNTK